MPPCNSFDIPAPGDHGAVVRALARRVSELGGALTGTPDAGSFSIAVPVFGQSVRGRYRGGNGAVRVEIQDRPVFLPCSLIEQALSNELGDGGTAPPPPASEFRIEVRFLGGLTRSQQDVFMGAAGRWSRIIVGDLPAVRLPSGEVIDDLVINARGAFIDGVNGVLGRAGPISLRNRSLLPFTGMMEFDTADLARMEMDGTLENVIVHEMGHVLGIGSLWAAGFFNLVRGAGGRNPLYVGANAAREFAALLGEPQPRAVPVENEGGPGTAGAHWRERVFMNELMTGFIGPGRNPLSRMTVGTLEDMGYRVNYDAADEYALPTPRAVQLQGLDAHLEQCGGPVMLRPRPVVAPEDWMMSET